MKPGEIIVLLFAGALGMLSAIGNIVADGFVTAPYHFGQFIGVFLVWTCILYTCLWVYRKVRDRNTPNPVSEVKA